MSVPRHTLATWRRPYDFSEEGNGTVPWMQGHPRILEKDEDAAGRPERAALGERKEKKGSCHAWVLVASKTGDWWDLSS